MPTLNHRPNHRSSMPKVCKAKTLSSAIKAFKEADQFTLSHIQKLRNEAYYMSCNNLNKGFYPLFNNPENFYCLSRKVATNLIEKVICTLNEMLMMFLLRQMKLHLFVYILLLYQELQIFVLFLEVGL